MEILIFALGAVIGSFLNVCIYRLPVSRSIVSPPSCCANCSKRLKPLDLIPILSYILLGGKCRYCKSQVSLRYPLVELLTGLVFVWAFFIFGFSYDTMFHMALFSILIVVFFIDLDHKIIPDGLNLTLFVLGIGYQLLTQDEPFMSSLAGFLIGGGFIAIVMMIGPMGGGDLKLMAALGVWLGGANTVLVLYLSFISGAVFGLAITRIRKSGLKMEIPFGPFIAVSSFLTIVFEKQLWAFINSYILSGAYEKLM